jgi:hypothetical protein
MFGPIAIAAALFSASAQEQSTQEHFERLAGTLKFFPTTEFAYGRSSKGRLSDLRSLPDKWADPWYAVLKELSSDQRPAADLQKLLKHSDPNVRLLALAALFQRQDPKFLPNIAAMLQDEGQTVPEFQIWRSFTHAGQEADVPSEQDFHPQTVGKVAKYLLMRWLEHTDYDTKTFEAYWAARQDRTYCASWFLARLCWASGGSSSHFDADRVPAIRVVRKDLDVLPERERDWTLLWVAASFSARAGSPLPVRAFVTTEELFQAGKRLGPDRLMSLIQNKVVCPDPDLAPTDGKTRGPYELILWIFKNAGQLLRSEDAPKLLAEEKALRWATPWCTIAAADLQPGQARTYLLPAFARFSEASSTHSENRAQLAAALWRIAGESEIDYLTDWFYGEKIDKQEKYYRYDARPHFFLEAIKDVRAPADRLLVSRIVSDARLKELDYESVRGLAVLVSSWTRVPLLGQRELYPNWEKGSGRPESAADAKIIDGWRTKLRNSLPEWQPK